jgi:hypothetical protein
LPIQVEFCAPTSARNREFPAGFEDPWWEKSIPVGFWQFLTGKVISFKVFSFPAGKRENLPAFLISQQEKGFPAGIKAFLSGFFFSRKESKIPLRVFSFPA